MATVKELAEKWVNESESQERLAGLLKLAGEKKGARVQDAFIQEIEKMAVRNGRAAGGIPSLGDCIITEQANRIAQYGERAFCLSEKQIAVIVRENWNYLKK